MRIRFLLGPAGSGKTFRCLTEIRNHLAVSPEGAPLLLVAPKQTTYQLERQLLTFESIPGYTRLFILSFERLAYFVFQSSGKQPPGLLDEEGRVMVLRGLLARNRERLRIFRASSRLTGFAQQLSRVLQELQRQQVTPDLLKTIAGRLSGQGGVDHKLADLAVLLELYQDWLEEHGLRDGDCLLNAATAILQGDLSQSHPRPVSQVTTAGSRVSPTAPVRPLSGGLRAKRAKAVPSDQLVLAFDSAAENGSANGDAATDGAVRRPLVQIGGLWIDGYAELSAQELDLVAAITPYCDQTTLTFCLEQLPAKRNSWLSCWSVVQRSFEEARKRFEGVSGADLENELVERRPETNRFRRSRVLQHLEQYWDQPVAFPLKEDPRKTTDEQIGQSIRLVSCETPESEATLAAREILRYVRLGGRFREVAVLVRKLEVYHETLQRVFARYQIPYFLDRRESVTHHPLAELTRSALRTIAYQWQHEDWFAALKTGLLSQEDAAIDELENEALARGWKGTIWQKPLQVKEQPRSLAERDRLIDLEGRLERVRVQIMPPFQALAAALVRPSNPPAGGDLVVAIREFWRELDVEKKLAEWAGSSETGLSTAVHATVWDQMNAWLDNLELAFHTETMALREWLPILEAGLGQLTIGVIPPALDQVLIGALDRSRNPDIRLACLLGMNETVFPAPPERSLLLTEADRTALEAHNLLPGSTSRSQLGRERHYAYIACTRAREQVILTHALNDSDGNPLNPSPFIAHIKKLFPALKTEVFLQPVPWDQSEHLTELLVPLLKLRVENQSKAFVGEVISLAGFDSILRELNQFRSPPRQERLAPALAERLYGPILHTSVSRLEQYAACPFKFFVHSGLRGEERRLFELDVKEQGTFQHDAMALFHQELQREGKRWRDVTPEQARERMGQVGQSLMLTYREGLLQGSEATRFMGRVLTKSLQDFVEVLVAWMRQQYLFDPARVELPFGQEDASPPWVLDLAGGHRLALSGRIDRVDVSSDPGSGQKWGVVVDYKSSHRQLDSVLLAHGVQLQLVAYLNVLRNWPDPASFPEARQLRLAGVFYVNLRGRYPSASTRTEALEKAAEDRRRAYRHSGRFDLSALPFLDSRSNVAEGDQFNFRRKQDRSLHKGSREALDTEEFGALLASVEQSLRRMGNEIFSGEAAVSPFRKGSFKACDQCACQAVCRFDAWEQPFRILEKDLAEEAD